MIPVYQREEHDCLLACVASILELPWETLADFPRGSYPGVMDPWEWHTKIIDAFRPYGLFPLTLHCAGFEPWPQCYFIGNFSHPGSKTKHAMVMFGDQVVHNPEREGYPAEEWTFCSAMFLIPTHYSEMSRERRA